MWDLGFTAFGGPPVHFQILHRRFVDGKGHFGAKWIDEQTVGFPAKDKIEDLKSKEAKVNRIH